MSRLEIARSAFTDSLLSGRLWLVQFFANLILFGFLTAWLLIPVASNLHLILNCFLAIALLAATLMLHAGTLNYFSDRQRASPTPLWPSFRRAFQHLLPVAICLAVICLLWLLVGNLEAIRSSIPAYVRSMLPVFLRRHITLPALDKLFACFVFFLRWIFVPGLILPFLSQTANLGFRGFARQGLSAWKRTVTALAFWLVLLLASLLGVLLTQALMAWTPDFRTSTFPHEAASFAARLFFAYLFGLFAWILTCSLVGRCGASTGTPSDITGNPAA
ncbi:MAG TPA: hypothetical protein VKH15_01820 [Candidatus Acidoferrum sp.]|nr:hypothetical protein [Candidatus Acidoferrum sp.]